MLIDVSLARGGPTRRMWRVAALLVAVALALSPGPAGTALAIIHGQPDADRHPFVGMVTNGTWLCSGTAISPKVLVLAAHCFDDAGATVRVTFDREARAEDAVWHEGRWHPHPDYVAKTATSDLAVVVLDRPAALPMYGTLPSKGLVDTLAAGTPVTVVGYGRQGRPGSPDPNEVKARHFARAGLLRNDRDNTADTSFGLSTNRGGDEGGVCFGDSGGPNLLRDTATILGVTSFSLDPNCAGASYAARIDTDRALSFIDGFLH